jgi:hypothetical protein
MNNCHLINTLPCSILYYRNFTFISSYPLDLVVIDILLVWTLNTCRTYLNLQVLPTKFLHYTSPDSFQINSHPHNLLFLKSILTLSSYLWLNSPFPLWSSTKFHFNLSTLRVLHVWSFCSPWSHEHWWVKLKNDDTPVCLSVSYHLSRANIPFSATIRHVNSTPSPQIGRPSFTA